MAGFSVATAGVMNGDGRWEIVVGAPGHENGQELEGAIHVYLGQGSNGP